MQYEFQTVISKQDMKDVNNLSDGKLHALITEKHPMKLIPKQIMEYSIKPFIDEGLYYLTVYFEADSCVYCDFKVDHGKSFLVQTIFQDEEMIICRNDDHYYISCATNDVYDPENGIREVNSKDIYFCPNCGRRLK